MIKIKKIEPPRVYVYKDKDEFVGYLNEYEFNDLRVQIKFEKISGYYFEFNNRRIYICSDGKLQHYPHGLFDFNTKCWMALI
jgi:hypothetical protein